jgi:hypothetical protein
MIELRRTLPSMSSRAAQTARDLAMSLRTIESPLALLGMTAKRNATVGEHS